MGDHMQEVDTTIGAEAFVVNEATETAEENQLKEELCSNEATDLKSSETTEVNETTKTSESNESLTNDQDNVIELKDTSEIVIANVSHESAIDDDKVTEEDLQKAVFIETNVSTEPTPIQNGEISIASAAKHSTKDTQGQSKKLKKYVHGFFDILLTIYAIVFD